MPPNAGPPVTPRPPEVQTLPPPTVNISIQETRQERPLPGWMVMGGVIQIVGLVVAVGLLIGGLMIYVGAKKEMSLKYPY